MPKTKARKPSKAKGNSIARTSNLALASEAEAREPQTKQRALRQPAKPKSIQNVVMSGMVALGCWGMSISFIFFTTDSNRYVYGGIAVLMALMWSFMFGKRLLRSKQQK